MHVSGFPFDLYTLLQFIFTAIVIAIGTLHLVKSTASKYFVVDANFEGGGGGEAHLENSHKNQSQMIAVDGCAVCGKNGIKQCSRCKSVRYCSGTCQSKHWKEGHNLKCLKLKLHGGLNAKLSNCSEKAAVCDSKSSKELPQIKKVLFPYEDFVKLFNWENSGFRPCGLLNCGNSCYANVVLQCLSCTRPLIAYLLEIGHAIKCKRNDWCFLCELEVHVERARHSWQPFSPINILSRLPNIGGNLGYGKQEDAHEFMRFAIDTMQSVCLDEFGGEKALHPSSQETSLIQYIFGGHLQSQVKCLKCNKISYRHENMMDLTVEIQGDSESLEECLDQFTAEEWLDGENMYKCDGCKDYVKACKRLAIHRAPNILTIALKRFQSGRFGKLNKRVTFPETLDLGPYMSEPGYGTDLYRLYAVVVHIDMLNASYFGHYVCYTKDFCGNWYRIDDCKVTTVELEDVLSQGAYMLLYSRMHVRPSCVNPLETCKEEKEEVVEETLPCSQAAVDSVTIEGSNESFTTVASMCTDVRSPMEEEKQRRVDVVKETQPLLRLPVEFITIEGSLNSLSTMPTDSNEDDSVFMNLDDPVEVNSRFAEGGPTTTTAPPAEEEKQRGVDVVEEIQPCLRLPVEPITVEGSVNFLSNMPTDSNQDNSVCMDLDDPLEFNSRFAEEDPASTTVDVPTDLESRSLDMDLDGPIRLDLMADRGYQLDPDLGNPESNSLGRKLDDYGSKHSDQTEIASSVEVFHEGVSTSDSLSEDSPLLKAHTLDRELSGTNFDDHSFEDGNRTTDNKESISNELSADDNLPSQSDIYELTQTSCSLPCSGLTKIPQQGNSSSLHSPLTPKLEQVNTVRRVNVIPAAWITKGNASKPVRDESCSNGKQSPLFSRGFLDKRIRCKSSKRNGKVLVTPVEVGSSCKASNNCNGLTAPGVSQNINVVHDLDGTFNSDGQYKHSLANGESEKFVDGVGLGHDCSNLSSHVAEIAPPVEHDDAHDLNGIFNSDSGHTPSLITGKSEKSLNGVGPSNDCSSSSSHVAEIAPPVEHVHNVPISTPSTWSFLPTEAYDLGHELNDPGFSVEHTFGNGNSCNKSAYEAVGSLPSQIDHEMNEISSSVPLCSDIEMLDESTSFFSSQSQQNSSLVQMASVELGNGIHAARNMEAFPLNMNNGNSRSRRPKPVFSPGFLDKQTRGKFQNRSDGPEDLGKVQSSCKVNNCNGSATAGSLLQTSKQANNFERNFDCDNSLKSTRSIENQCKKIFTDGDEENDEALGDGGDLPQSQCNGNGSCNDLDEDNIGNKNQGQGTFWGNGKDIFSPGFLSKQSRKKSLKKDKEPPGLDEIVSSNHDRNKLPRFG